MDSLDKYLERECVPPPIGKPFPLSPEEEVIAAVAKSNLQRKEYNKTRKKAEKIRKAREHSAAVSKKDTDGGYDSDPFEDVENPLRQASKQRSTGTADDLNRTVETEASYDMMERGSEPPGVRANEIARRERTAEVFTAREGATHGVEEYKSANGGKHPTGRPKRGGSLKKMIRKMHV